MKRENKDIILKIDELIELCKNTPGLAKFSYWAGVMKSQQIIISNMTDKIIGNLENKANKINESIGINKKKIPKGTVLVFTPTNFKN